MNRYIINGAAQDVTQGKHILLVAKHDLLENTFHQIVEHIPEKEIHVKRLTKYKELVTTHQGGTLRLARHPAAIRGAQPDTVIYWSNPKFQNDMLTLMKTPTEIIRT